MDSLKFELHVISVGIVGGTGYTGVELLRLFTTTPKCANKMY